MKLDTAVELRAADADCHAPSLRELNAQFGL